MFKAYKKIHEHSLEVEKSLNDIPNDTVRSKSIERTFGIMGSMLTAVGFSIAITSIENEAEHVRDWSAKHETSVFSVAEMGLLDPVFIVGGSLFGYAGLENIAIANSVRRRRLDPGKSGPQQTNIGE
jgi:hypothetical protein